jgi:sugar lactone lactonase YvrE
MAIDSTSAYFTDNDSVWKVSLDGASRVQIATGLNTPRGIAIDTTDVYVAEYGYASVKKVSKSGGAVTALMSDFPNTNSNPQAIAVDAGYAYWTEFFTGTVKRVPINGGTVTTFSAGPVPYNYNQAGSSIALDAAHVYWIQGSSLRVSPPGGGSTTLTSMAGSPAQLALDATSLYWTDASSGVRKIPVGGGTISQIETMGLPPRGIAVDATHVYWVGSNTGDGAVYRAPK